MSTTVLFLFQTIQFSFSTQCNSIWPINTTQSGATTPGQSGPGNDGNKGVLHIPQLFSVILPGHSFGESYTSAEMHSVYSITPADRATGHSLGEVQSVYFASPADWASKHTKFQTQ